MKKMLVLMAVVMVAASTTGCGTCRRFTGCFRRGAPCGPSAPSYALPLTYAGATQTVVAPQPAAAPQFAPQMMAPAVAPAPAQIVMPSPAPVCCPAPACCPPTECCVPCCPPAGCCAPCCPAPAGAIYDSGCCGGQSYGPEAYSGEWTPEEGQIIYPGDNDYVPATNPSDPNDPGDASNDPGPTT